MAPLRAWLLFVHGSACLLHFNHATASLPADLDDLVVFDKDGNGALSGGQLAHAATRGRVRLDVMLDEIAALPLQPFPHLAGVRTARRAENFKLGHGAEPPARRG